MPHSRSQLRPLAAAAPVFAALPAAATTRIELQAGRSYMDSHAANAAFVELVLPEHRLGDSGLSVAPDFSVGWIGGRDVARYRHARYRTRDESWLAAAGVRVRFADADAWYRALFFSFQPAWHAGRTQALSSGYEFVSTQGWQWRHWSIHIRHVSNGGLHNPNRGETMALLGVGFGL